MIERLTDLISDMIGDDYSSATIARAVLEALREPTPGMVAAAISEYVGDVDAELTWKAMITAAIEGE